MAATEDGSALAVDILRSFGTSISDIEKLKRVGVTTADAVLRRSYRLLQAIKGISTAKAEKLHEAGMSANAKLCEAMTPTHINQLAECPICMEGTDPSKMVMLHGEMHSICSACVPKWISFHQEEDGAMRCPLCREPCEMTVQVYETTTSGVSRQAPE